MLFLVTKNWKQPKCPSAVKQNKLLHIHMMDDWLLNNKKNELLIPGWISDTLYGVKEVKSSTSYGSIYLMEETELIYSEGKWKSHCSQKGAGRDVLGDGSVFVIVTGAWIKQVCISLSNCTAKIHACNEYKLFKKCVWYMSEFKKKKRDVRKY